MQIITGLDFDGPIHNSHKLKKKLAYELFDLEIEGHLLNSRSVERGNLPISVDQYNKISKIAYGFSEETLKMMELTPGAIAAIRSLQRAGHRIVIVTARVDDALHSACRFLQQNDLDLEIHGVGFGVNKRSKIEELGLDNYVDDNLGVLEKVIGAEKTKLYHLNDDSECFNSEIEQAPNWPILLHKLLKS